MSDHYGHRWRVSEDGETVYCQCSATPGDSLAGKTCDSVYREANEDSERYQALLDAESAPRSEREQTRADGWFDRLGERERVQRENEDRRYAS